MDIRLPSEFTNRMKDMLGGSYDDFIGCYEDRPVKSLRLNRRKISPVDYARLSRIFVGDDKPENVPLWQGAYYYNEDGPGKSPYHEAGAYYIQEASAMLPVTLLDVDDSGMRVLDLCAAPGGKSTQIADLMNGRGLLVSNEYVPSRAQILSENIERMGVENALVISADPKDLADRFPVFFDRILVDAPCSGEGMFRRNPEAVNEWSLENVAMCADRQDMILDCAAQMLAPGGRIVYSTCTFSPEEDEECVERFLARHQQFEVCDETRQLYPHTFRGEGHFAVSLLSKGTVLFDNFESGAGGRRDATKRVPQARGLCRSVEDCLSDWRPHIPYEVRDATRRGTGQDPHLVYDFLDNTLNNLGSFWDKLITSGDRLLEFGDSLYLAPEFMPDIKGLKVYRAGIKLGTFKKNRFEPDHALSHVLTPGDVKYYVNLSADSNEVRQYLSGMTVNCDRDMKGWCLVCIDDFPLGWGKAANGVIKNHYPKGLRR